MIPGGYSLVNKPYRYVPPHGVGGGVGCLRRFGLKTGVHIQLPILVWNRVWFSRELRECMNVFTVSMSKKEREICEFETDLNIFFVCALI